MSGLRPVCVRREILALVAVCLTASLVRGAVAKPPSELAVTVTPAAEGWHLVRFSLPLPKGWLKEGQALIVSDGRQEVRPGLRVLTWHPASASEAKSARRALVTFPYDFTSPPRSTEAAAGDRRAPLTFPQRFAGKPPVRFVFRQTTPSQERAAGLPVAISLSGETLNISYQNGILLTARIVAPPLTNAAPARVELVESNACYLWQRFHFADSLWPRIIEARADVLGQVVVVAHLQRNLPGDGYAPNFGWELHGLAPADGLAWGHEVLPVSTNAEQLWVQEDWPISLLLDQGKLRVYHPAAHLKRRGSIGANREPGGGWRYLYSRRAFNEKIPMQAAAWQRAEFVIAPVELALLTPALQSDHLAEADWRLWDQLYGTGPPLDLSGEPELSAALRYHYAAIVRSMARGDDWGSVTGYSDDSRTGSVFGMNRLNHCPPLFGDAQGSGDWAWGGRGSFPLDFLPGLLRRHSGEWRSWLRETALLWCDNFFDQSIWWGPGQTGGTRYNNIRAQNRTPPDDDQTYMWRSNDAVNFCTKGYDSFFLAYEETGDPRMLEALEAQTRYASQHVHADQGECRNIGDVRDFVRLYQMTGQTNYLAEGLRLFRELRTKLSTGDLFSQSGHPLEPDPPFIDDDDKGYRHPFAKPYIIGYALAGLPELARYAPDEPKLREVVQAVADFLAESQDPLGGWRYPHPRSSYLILGQAMEHAWQLVQADKLLGPQPKHLDAIERVLRQRILAWRKTGKVFSGVTGWELATGKVKQRSDLYNLYQRPNDRPFERDYAEGGLEFGSCPPEGLVYFPEVLAFYLQHRPASRLLAPPAEGEPLAKVLNRK